MAYLRPNQLNIIVNKALVIIPTYNEKENIEKMIDCNLFTSRVLRYSHRG